MILQAFALWQLGVSIHGVYDRRHKYNQALAYAKEVGKPLLIVGGPYGDFPLRRLARMPAHGCGDICYDIVSCACHDCSNFVQGDVRDMSAFRDKQFGAVFISHVLEHLPTVDDATRAWHELHRVADKVFHVYPTKQSVVAWFAPGHKLWVWNENDTLVIEERRR